MRLSTGAVFVSVMGGGLVPGPAGDPSSELERLDDEGSEGSGGGGGSKYRLLLIVTRLPARMLSSLSDLVARHQVSR